MSKVGLQNSSGYRFSSTLDQRTAKQLSQLFGKDVSESFNSTAPGAITSGQTITDDAFVTSLSSSSLAASGILEFARAAVANQIARLNGETEQSDTPSKAKILAKTDKGSNKNEIDADAAIVATPQSGFWEEATTELATLVEEQIGVLGRIMGGPISQTQRAALEAEFQALSTEYNRVYGEMFGAGSPPTSWTTPSGYEIGLTGGLNYTSTTISSENLTVSGGTGTPVSLVDTVSSSLDAVSGGGGTVLEVGGAGTKSLATGGGTTRISTDSSGNQSTGGASRAYAISADGRYVAFWSGATNLVAGDTNGQFDSFIKDTLTGVTTRISTDSAGNEATGGNSFVNAISADGRYVAFHSLATNLVAGDTNGVSDVFIKDTLTGVTTRISTDSSGNQTTGGASYVSAISSDGRYVAFWSGATNLVAGDTNGVRDSFIKDTLTGTTTRISTDSAGKEATGGGSYVTAISSDGRYVAFSSNSTNLVAGDTNGVRDSFIKDTLTGTTTRISTDSAGNEATGGLGSFVTALSADGRYVAFHSDATNLVAGDTNGLQDVFIKDTVTGVTNRVSTDSEGNQATGGSSVVQALSADGRYVAFHSTATNLVAGDTNGQRDSFVKDTVTGVTTRISTDSEGNQATGGSSQVTALSADGRYAVFYSTSTNLVAGDTNGQSDVFIKDLWGYDSFIVVQDGTNIDLDVNSITSASHGLTTGTRVTVSSSGTLPGGLAASTNYYAIVVDSNTIKLAASPDSALAGTALNITSLGAGNLTITYYADNDFNAATDEITFVNNNLVTGQRLQFSGAGSTPTGLTKGVDYYAISTGDPNTFKVATSLANALADVAVDFSGSASGQIQMNYYSDISTATDSIRVANHGLTTGTVVRIQTAGVAPGGPTGMGPGGLSEGIDYYAIIVDSDNIKLATSALNASNGTGIDITSTGVGPLRILTGAPSVAETSLAGPGIFGEMQFQGSPFGSIKGGGIVALDFDQDGDMDVASVNNGNALWSAIELSVNDGAGGLSFLPAATLSGTQGVSALATADFNGDGDPDIISKAYSDHEVILHLGGSGSTFTRSVLDVSGGIGGSAGTRTLQTGDFNDDSQSDIVFLDGNGIANILIGNGNGTFQAAQTFDISGISAVGNSVAVLDFDRDGRDDLAVDVDGSIRLFSSNGDGTFSAATSISSSGWALNVVDINGDGYQDLAQRSGSAGAFIFTSTGAGTFSAAQTLSFQTNVADLAFADMNADGFADVVGYGTDGALRTKIGDGTGNFGADIVSSATALEDYNDLRIALADLNGDGVPDIAVNSRVWVPSGLLSALSQPAALTLPEGEVAGTTTRVSTDSSGAQATGGSSVTAMSADGRFVAFNSAASNLVAGDTNGEQDAFIKDTLTGVTTRVSSDSSGNQATGGSSGVSAISADGRYVAFSSAATNLVAGDTNGETDSFIKDTLTGITTRISTDSAGNQSNGYSTVTALSADGRYVAFMSAADDLVAGDTNYTQDAFIKDTLTGVTTRISTDSAGNQSNGFSTVYAISADGRFVAFNSVGTNLVAGDTNGQTDSFIKDTLTGVTTRVSTDSVGNQATGGVSYVRAISADGRYVAFSSAATNLVAGDTNGQTDSFIKDTLTGVTTRISTDSAGNEATGGNSFVRAISADGRYVAFHSFATNLVAGDTNGVSDVFIKDTLTGVTTRISTDSSGNQATGGVSYVRAISADGRYVAFRSSASNLVAGDTNGQTDAFIKDFLGSHPFNPTTNEVTHSAHGLITGQSFRFDGTGTVPTGLSTDTKYYAIVSTANTFKVATSYANALANTAIDFSGSASGTVTVEKLTTDTSTERVTIAAHGFTTGDQIRVTSTDNLPGGLARNTDYYAIVDNVNNIRFATSSVNALAGTAIDLTSEGTGTLSVFEVSGGASSSPFDPGTDEITLASNGFTTGQTIRFTGTGAAPTGLVKDTDYYAIATGNPNTFKVAATYSAALASSAINFTSASTGELDVIAESPAARFNAATNQITVVGSSVATGQRLQFAGSGTTLPTGLSTGTDYYAIAVDADNFRVATSLANALAATAIDFSGTAAGDISVTLLGGSDFDPAADTISITGNTLSTGQRVSVSSNGGAYGYLPTGLSAGNYYVIKGAGDTISLALSESNANNGIAVNFTGSGASSIRIEAYTETTESSSGTQGNLNVSTDLGAISTAVTLDNLTSSLDILRTQSRVANSRTRNMAAYARGARKID
jgi:hypothetical protein